MTYPPQGYYPPAKPPTSTSVLLVWAAVALAVLGVLLAVASSTVSGACDGERQAVEVAVKINPKGADSARAQLRMCEKKASAKSAPLATGSAMALMLAAGAGVGAYANSDSRKRAADERRHQRAWAAYNAPQQQAPQPQGHPQYQQHYPTEDYSAAVAPDPAKEDTPWYLRGDKA